jgi:hypothetical protein
MSRLCAAASSRMRSLTATQVCRGLMARLLAVEADTQPTGHLDARQRVRGRDQGLAGDTVGEHGGTAKSVAVDNGDFGSEMRGNQGSLIPTWAATNE